ncbi:hypothetical protein M407DRAFT_216521 [Tulasnella calospora MUT 4182]|uniref:Uncharacterized protein n=1 Tax=Tulasnella calospora MUT 4182 TaxID=1051891 RepID=A0A0C3LDJ5_9AGAM|nr:hypothetical protein M407DRAFT_216521 [Tulasnella calospora MUT 4182]
MNNLPKTTERDLHIMGITTNMIKEAIEKSDKAFHGKVVGVFLPPDNYKGDPSIRQARNYLKSDWTLVTERPPVAVNQERNDETLNNFRGRDATQVELKQTVSITTGTNYRLTQPFNVKVNASIPVTEFTPIQLGKKGPIKFTATETEADIQSSSSSQTESRHFPFTLDVPAGEGRIICSTTTQTSTDTVFRAVIGVQGTVGIEINPAWYRPNYYKYIHKIEDVFPHATAKSEIIRSHLDTKVDTIIRKADKREAGDIIEYRSPISPERIIDAAPLTNNIGDWLNRSLMHGSPAPADFTCDVTVRIDFRNEDPIPVNKRDVIVQALILGIQSSIQPQGCIGSIEGATWKPDREAHEQGIFCIPFDPTRISRNNLILEFLKTASGLAWNGPHVIHFT